MPNNVVGFKINGSTYKYDRNELANLPDIDSVPTQGSTNAVSSGGVYSALADKADKDSTPETVTPIETDADFYVCDSNGNVIAEFVDGHIRTKNFDSSDINTETDTTLSVQGKPADAKAVGDAIDVLQDEIDNIEPSGGTGNVDAKDSTETSVDLDISDSGGNVLLRLANGHIATKYFNSADFEESANVLTVAQSGADYTTIRGAVEGAQTAGASKDNPYTIKIASGSYDILSEFTSAEIADSAFVGLMITDGITLEGTGLSRDDVVIYAEMDTTAYDVQKRNMVSTLNFRGNVGLKNLTVKSTNMRYAIHDDFSFASNDPKVRHVENCHIYAHATTSWNTGNIGYGAGCDGNKVFIFDDTDFGDTLFIHTYTGNLPNLAIMRNCRAFGFLAKDYPTTAYNHFYMYGCAFKWVRGESADGWTAQHLFIHGDLKGAMVEGWSGMAYELGDSFNIQSSPVSTAPKAIANAMSGRVHIKTATGADDTIGILYNYNPDSGNALVQYGGWICAELIGFTNPTIGQYLVVANDGTLSLNSSDTNSIGKVAFATETGKHFINLTI